MDKQLTFAKWRDLLWSWQKQQIILYLYVHSPGLYINIHKFDVYVDIYP